MSNQIYSVPYGTLQLHHPSQSQSSAAALVNGNFGQTIDQSTNNSNNQSGRASLSLAGSPTPSADEEDQDNSADYSIGGSSNSNSNGKSNKGTPKPRARKASTGASNKKSGGGAKKAAGGSRKKAGTPVTGGLSEHDESTGRRKIRIQFVEDDNRRHVTFSKRKAGIMKKAYELATLTGTQVLLLIVSQSDQVFTFATPKLQPIVMESEGQELIQSCLQAPDAEAKVDEEADGDGGTEIKLEEQEEEEEVGKGGGEEDPNFEREEGFNADDVEAEGELDLDQIDDNDRQLETIQEDIRQEEEDEVQQQIQVAPQKGKRGGASKTPKSTKGIGGGGRANKKAKLQAQPIQQPISNHRNEDDEEEEAEPEENLPPALIHRNQRPPSQVINDVEEEQRIRPNNKRSRDEVTSESLVSIHSNHDDTYGENSTGDHINVNTGIGGLNQYWSGANDHHNNRTTTGNHHPHSNYSHLSNYHSPQLSSNSSPIVNSGTWSASGRDGEKHFRNHGLNHNSSMNTMFTGPSTSSSTSTHPNPYKNPGAYDVGWGV